MYNVDRETVVPLCNDRTQNVAIGLLIIWLFMMERKNSVLCYVSMHHDV